MKLYVGMTLYHEANVCGEIIQAEYESTMLAMASKIINKRRRLFGINEPVDFFTFDIVAVDESMFATTPLPKQCYTRVSGGKWEYKGNAPKEVC